VRSREPRPIVVQGAMDVEIRKLAGAIRTRPKSASADGRSGAARSTVSRRDLKTLKGMENAAAATAIAAERYRPIAIINQGTAEATSPTCTSDIVLGRHAVNLGSFKTGYRARPGSDRPVESARPDALGRQRRPGSNARTMRRFAADEGLLAAARLLAGLKGRVVEGDRLERVWNSEIDRISVSRPVRHDRRGDGRPRRPRSPACFRFPSSASEWCRTTS
jgi:adenosylhomocysteine nucleosidase